MSDLKIFTDNIEQEAIYQIQELIKQPAFSDCKVRIMPDVHAGKGCVIGFTADLGDKVIPNIVGVDIGCGMLALNLGKIDIDYDRLDKVIRGNIPYGRNVRYDKIWFKELKNIYCYPELNNIDWLEKSLGSLGGGNHFIEIDKDKEDNKYLIIHTGSRNLGKQVADIYQKLAIKKCKSNDVVLIINKYKEEGREKELELAIKNAKNKPKIPNDLCYLEGEDRKKYLHDMKICQTFASENRINIAKILCEKMTWEFNENNLFQTIHNYIDHDTNIVRKGAISAKDKEMVIIPLNMRDGCIIGIGKGNVDWNYSAPHGAGRLMSRAKAKDTLRLIDFKDSMEGIFSKSVNINTIDEAPMVYKDMKEIIENIKDTVDIDKVIKPVYNFKADN